MFLRGPKNSSAPAAPPPGSVVAAPSAPAPALAASDTAAVFPSAPSSAAAAAAAAAALASPPPPPPPPPPTAARARTPTQAHLELRDAYETTITLTQTATISGQAYETAVTFGGNRISPTTVPAAAAAAAAASGDLTNGQIGGIIGGVTGFLIVAAVLFCVYLRARAQRRYAEWYYRRYGTWAFPSSSSPSPSSSSSSLPRSFPSHSRPADGFAVFDPVRGAYRYQTCVRVPARAVPVVQKRNPAVVPLNVTTAPWDPTRPNRGQGL